MKKILLAALIPSAVFASESPCNYNHRVTSSYVKQIDRVIDIDKFVSRAHENVNVCKVSMTVVIAGETYDTDGQFSFGPDMSENIACGHAEQRAKENIIRRVSPEMLSANTNMECGAKKEPPAPRQVTSQKMDNFIPNPNYPYRPVDSNYQMPQVIFQYHQPEPVIIYQHQNTEGLTPLDLLRLGISILPFVGK